MEPASILVVEDEDKIARLLELELTYEGAIRLRRRKMD